MRFGLAPQTKVNNWNADGADFADSADKAIPALLRLFPFLILGGHPRHPRGIAQRQAVAVSPPSRKQAANLERGCCNFPCVVGGNSPAIHAATLSDRLLLFHPQYRKRAEDPEPKRAGVATKQVICEIREICPIRVLVVALRLCGQPGRTELSRSTQRMAQAVSRTKIRPGAGSEKLAATASSHAVAESGTPRDEPNADRRAAGGRRAGSRRACSSSAPPACRSSPPPGSASLHHRLARPP